ncbi:Doa1 [Kluyveromyces lactis]|nr:Doa1 [Kluyveromyces lactis]
MYQLSAQLRGHTQDVRSVVSLSATQVASASRDGTVRIWNLGADGNWEGSITFSSEKFVNSLTYDAKQCVLFCGGQEKIIYGVSPLLALGQEPVYTLLGHEGNICSLSGDFESLVSSSWDKTAKVWTNGIVKWELKGHSASVWDAKLLNDGSVLTASADTTVKLWKNGTLAKTFDKLHSDVVRNICILDDGNHFVSCSNDGTLKLSNLEGGILHEFIGHESFVYAVKQLPSGDIVSCGEDRTVRIWNVDGTIKQVITLPAISIWTVDVLPNGDIVVGSSDKIIRIFTENEQRLASQEEIASLQKQVEESAVNAQAMGFDESKLKPLSVLQKPGEKEGQIVVVKNENGVIEAHQFTGGSWSKVGDVLSSSGSDNKVEYEGKNYDFVFDVDIEEGKPPLKLPVNANDNPYDVADKFITRYELPTSYKDQIVQFIVTNTKSTTLDQPSDVSRHADVNYKIFPVKNYLKLTSFNPDSLFNGIVKLNQAENTFDDDALGAIGSALHDVENNIELLYAHACIIKNQWKGNKTPAYDIVRILTPKLPSSDDMSEFIEEGLSQENPISTMLTTRMLANCFSNQIWGKELMGKPALYDSVFQILDSDYPNCKPQQKDNLAIAIATLLFNYTVYVLESNDQQILPIIADVLNTKYGSSSLFLNSEEATYRLLIAYGNLATVEPSLHQYAKSISWIIRAKDKYGKIGRFEDVFEDLFR